MKNSEGSKKNEYIQKVFLIVLMGLFFITLFLRPQYQNYQNNRLLLENKKKILTASHSEISEEDYLKELNQFEIELDVYRRLIPEQQEQQCLYDGLKEMIEKSEGELIELQFGTDFIIETPELIALLDEEKKIRGAEFKGKQLYGIPIKIRIEGEGIKKIFNCLEVASPLMSISSFQFKESMGKNHLDLELIGYYFKEVSN